MTPNAIKKALELLELPSDIPAADRLETVLMLLSDGYLNDPYALELEDHGNGD